MGTVCLGSQRGERYRRVKTFCDQRLGVAIRRRLSDSQLAQEPGTWNLADHGGGCYCMLQWLTVAIGGAALALKLKFDEHGASLVADELRIPDMPVGVPPTSRSAINRMRGKASGMAREPVHIYATCDQLMRIATSWCKFHAQHSPICLCVTPSKR